MSYWIVICPEPSVRGGVWALWFKENCVAAGWPPPAWSLEGATESNGWEWSRDRLKQVRIGDKVVPFLLKWRIGPVGTVTGVQIADSEWNPTVEEGKYDANPGEPELGRRVLVKWEADGMPTAGKVALVPAELRPNRPLARHTIEELLPDQYERLCSVLRDKANWVDITSTVEPSAQSEVAFCPAPASSGISLLERDLQKFLSRNLHLIEPGLVAHPEYQLEEYQTDVGRIDLLCQDAKGSWVVVELKADWAGDDAIGQVLGYMGWVRDNLPNGSSVRGVLICKNPTPRIQAAAKLVGLSIKRFLISFSIENVNA